MIFTSRNKFLLLTILLSIYFIIFSILITVIPLYAEIVGIFLSVLSLYISGDVFIDEARTLGKRNGFSSKSVGVYLISLGAVVDEFAVIISASAKGYGGISFGTIQGSNIITLVSFLVILPFVFAGSYRKFAKDGLVLLISTFVLLGLTVIYTIVPWYVGFLLILVFLMYLYVGKSERIPMEMEAEKIEYSSISLIASLVLLILASQAIVEYTHGLSGQFHISPFISGFIITGIVGSLPEIIMFSLSILKRDMDATIGIVTGSTIYKGTIILGISMFFGVIELGVGLNSIYLMILLSLIFLLFTAIKVRKYLSVIPLVAVLIFGIFIGI